MGSTFSANLIEGPVEESRPCTCGGSNENCYRCSGTGIIQRHLEAVPPSNPVRRWKVFDLSGLLRRFGTKKAKQAAERSAVSRMIQCDRCKFRGLPEAVKSHKLATHTSKENPHRTAIIDSVAPPKRNRNSSAQIATASRSRNHFVRCAICRSSVKAINFRKHMSKVHGFTTGPVPSSFIGRSRRKGREQRVNRTSKAPAAVDDLQIIDQREAHRQMGFVVRENGRYGSHPLHDRFDDESEP